MKHVVVALAAAAGLAGCHHVSATHNLCGGTVACPKDPCAPVEIVYGRPSRPFQPLGVVQVRVDRGTMFSNPTLNDAIPALEAEARAMGADAVVLTHEEFTSWYDKGEDASPIHDLERQESWYVTEKGRFVSGLAVVYTGAACVTPMPMPMTPGAPSGFVPTPGPGGGERVVYSVIIPGTPAPAPAPSPYAAPPPPPPPPSPAPESAPRPPSPPVSAVPAPRAVETASLPPPRRLR